MASNRFGVNVPPQGWIVTTSAVRALELLLRFEKADVPFVVFLAAVDGMTENLFQSCA
jgi:hypothetical protein